MIDTIELRELHDSLATLQSEGYSFQVDANGWRVDHGARFVSGATVLLPRSTSLHWRHARANVRDNLSHAVDAARRDRRSA